MNLLAGLRKFFTRANLEDPSVSLAAFDDDRPTLSGVTVNQDQALKYAPVFRAISLIGSDVGKVPLIVYRRTDNGKDREPGHAAYPLLHYKPNPYMNAYVFKLVMQMNASLHGRAYAFIERRPDGRPKGLWPLNSLNVYVRINSQRLWYMVRTGATEEAIDPDNILHIRGPGDHLDGYSAIEYGAQTMGLGIAARDYGATFFGNSAEPSGVITIPQVSQPAAENIINSWKKRHGGKQRHGIGVLEGGADYKIIALSAKDAQLLESLQHSTRDIAVWFGIPPHKLGDTSRTAYNSLEQENQAYLSETLDPWFVCWEEECRDKLLSEREKEQDSHVVEFKREALVRTDLAARGEYYAKATAGAPWMVINEIRKSENLPSLGDEFNNILLPTNNFGAQQDAAEPEPPPPADDGEDESAGASSENLRKYALEALEVHKTRLQKRLDGHAKKAGQQGLGAAELAAEIQRVDLPIIRENLESTCKMLAELDKQNAEDRLKTEINDLVSPYLKQLEAASHE